MALVLSRKVNETLIIGNARVTVVRVTGDTVRLAIEAPRDVNVVREELCEELVEELCNGSQCEGAAAGHDGRAKR